MSSGGKGGKQESTFELPPWLEAESKELIRRGKDLAKLPPMPYTGLTMAAPSGATKQGLTNSNLAANALGIGMTGDILAGLPQETEMDGMTGYRAYDLYTSEVDRQREINPSLIARYEALSPGIFGEGAGQAAPDGYRPGTPGGGGAGGRGGGPGRGYDPNDFAGYDFDRYDMPYTIEELMAMYGRGGFTL